MSNQTTKTDITMFVPQDQAESVRAFMEQLSMSSINTETNAQSSGAIKVQGDQCAVKSVMDHRVTSDGWSFQISWDTGYGKSVPASWVADKDTDCEFAISEYLGSKNIRTAYCFCRVSTKKQAGGTHVSLDAQSTELQNLSRKETPNHRIKICQISASAYRNIPDELVKIGEAAGSGDVIYIYRVDRLSRNIFESLSWIEDLDHRGVVVYSLSENLRYDQNKLAFTQSILDAQKESKLLSDRVNMSIKMRRDRGDHIGRPKYGMKHFRDTNGSIQVTRNPDELKIINFITKSSGSPSYIAKSLNSRRMYKRGKKWNKGMVKRIVS